MQLLPNVANTRHNTGVAVVACAECLAPCVPAGCSTGYGTDPLGVRRCFACCNRRELAEFLKADTYVAYVTGDKVTTWPGGELARVTWRKRARVGFCRDGLYINAIAADGSRWYGRNAGDGMCIKLRRTR